MIKKIKNFLSNKRNITMMLALCLTLAMSAVCFATGETITAPDFSSITTAFTTAFPVTVLITILAATVVAGGGFVLMWFGYRALKQAVMRGLFKGKL